MPDPLDTLQEREALVTVLDELVPAREGGALPGAGTLGIDAAVREKIGEGAPFVAAGLATLDARAREQGAAGFAALPAEARAPLLAEAGAAHPGFLESLLFHTYTSYYQHPRVLEALGLPPRPPAPEGYPLEDGDLAALERVRARGRMFREV